MTGCNDTIEVEVVYAVPEQQTQVRIKCLPGTRLADAIRLSGIARKIDIDEETLLAGAVGVYGFRRPLDFRLSDQDRVEIYRPLSISPVEARRLRAQKRQAQQRR